MEISKGLQQEIQLVQNKLKNAIRDHQICVGKLKDDPNNADILGRIQEIQLHIVALGRCQKQVVQRLRKEVEAFKSENASEVKVSVASLLGLNNNNHITANNEATADEISEVKVVVTNGLDNARLAAAKEDYEEIVRNGDVARPPRVNVRKKERSLSVETLSAEEEITEVVEVDENSDDKRRVSREPESPPPPPPEQRKPNCKAQLNFLETLGLITTSKFTELQNKRAERKRRSTANPQFVYSNWEIPTKRKRHNYLQSAANVPQTRQTTARLNGPSPPPTANKAASAVPPPKSTSPPTRTIAKSLIPTQKATTRPNILRNMAESRVFVNKGRMENGNGQVQLPSGAKTVAQTTGNSKTVHIPGLPLGLTIERIENDSAVCINCRNPGTLTNCDNCEANYHVSCHTISPPPPRLCPKCALRLKDSNAGVGPATTTTTPPPSTTTKKNEELVAAPHAPGVAGQAGEDPEVDKAPSGFHKAGAAAKQQQQPHQQQQQHQIAGRGVNQLPASTFLIPISSNALATAGGAFGHPDASSSSLNLLKSPGDTSGIASSPNEVPFSTSLVIGHQLSRSSVTYVPQSSQPQHQHQRLSYAYQLPLGAASSDAPKSYFIVKKIADPGKPIDGSSAGNSQSSSASSSSSSRGRSARGDETSGGGGGGRAASHLDKLTGRLAESIARGWKKKSATRAIPGLNRIAPGKSLPATAATTAAVATDNADRDDVDKSPGVAHNGGGSTSRQSGGNQQQQQQNQRIAGRRGSAATTFVKRRGLENAAGKTGEQRQLVVRKKSRGKFARAAVDSVLAVDNAADKLADRGDDEKRGEGTAAAAIGGSDETRESDSRAAGEDRSGGCDVAAAAEHVKLEEAHLSAPPGAKLMRDEEQKQQKKKPGGLGEDRRPIGRLRNAARIMSSRRRTTEDRARTPDLTRASDASRQERNRPRILMRPERKSLESGESLLGDSAANGRRFDPDFAAFGPRGLRKAVGSETDSADEDSSHEFGGADREEVGTTMRKFVDRKDEEIERKDLSEELEAEGNDEEDEEEGEEEEIEEEDDEEDEEVEEEEEEEDQEDCPILDEDMNDAANERRLGINAVSPESLQVLEQFESAMLQSASGDLTAKP